jgi:hypothetical protein
MQAVLPMKYRLLRAPTMATRVMVIHRKKITRSDSSMLERVIQERLCWQFSA